MTGIARRQAGRWSPLLLLLGLAALPRAAAALCPTSWYVSWGGTEPFELLHVDTFGLPLESLRFDMGYDDPTQPSGGRLDFDGDGRTDVFATVPFGLEEPLEPGEYAWLYSSAGTGEWQQFGISTMPPEDLRFGNFDGDALTDVFFLAQVGDFSWEWRYAPATGGGYIPLQTDGTPLHLLRFGDFNGDDRTDLFTLGALSQNGARPWLVSYNGTLPWFEEYVDGTPIQILFFANVNGGGTGTDVVMPPAFQNSGSWAFYSPASNAGGDLVTGPDVQDEMIGFGDLDANGTSEAIGLKNYEGSNYLTGWFRGNDGSLAALPLSFDPAPLAAPSQYRLGDFDGDRLTDVFIAVPCPEPAHGALSAAALLVLARLRVRYRL